jgi:hypothetical protein
MNYTARRAEDSIVFSERVTSLGLGLTVIIL